MTLLTIDPQAAVSAGTVTKNVCSDSYWVLTSVPKVRFLLDGEAVQEQVENSDVRNYVSRLWAEDWDCPEDQVYDRM